MADIELTPGEIVAHTAKLVSELEDSLREAQEGLELQGLAAEAVGDKQRRRQVHSIQAQLQSAQACTLELNDLLRDLVLLARSTEPDDEP